MDPIRTDGHRHRSPGSAILRTLLLTPIPTTGTRLVDMVIWPVGFTVAVVVGLPLLAVAVLAGAAVGLALQAVGAPEAVVALPGLIGFVGGLALDFVVFLRIYRRFPTRIRAWVTPEDDPPDVGMKGTTFVADPAADRATLKARVAAADATLTVDDPTPVDG